MVQQLGGQGRYWLFLVGVTVARVAGVVLGTAAACERGSHNLAEHTKQMI